MYGTTEKIPKKFFYYLIKNTHFIFFDLYKKNYFLLIQTMASSKGVNPLVAIQMALTGEIYHHRGE
ncbi:MAG: hypothetical protein CSA18_00365 [Deltaproteobacteria bacterium]|nr:MAG: hypothetical protein CSA18_00365 [Deltaproteobacteria bacterium]